jgi:hypothetical protein
MKSKLSLPLLAALLLAAPAQAQPEGTKFGIGVSLIQSVIAPDFEELQFGTVALSNIYVPIIIGSSFKLEPEIGFYRLSEEEDTFEGTLTQWRFGLGAFYYLPAAASVRVYVGPRVGLQLTSLSAEEDVDLEFGETDFVFGLALGGEYFFSDHFSLGGEVQLNYVSLGEPDVEVDGVDQDFDLSRNFISNNGLILMRWYF